MKALVPFAAVLVAFLAYFYYRMETCPFKSMLGVLVEFGVPFVITMVLAMMLTVEVFYYLKVKKPLKFHAKRFGMNALLVCVVVASFFVTAVSADAMLSPYVGERGSLLIALVSWSLVVAGITMKFQRTIRKYWKEP